MTTATLRLSIPLSKERTAPRKRRFYDVLIETYTQRAMQEIAMHRNLMPESPRMATFRRETTVAWWPLALSGNTVGRIRRLIQSPCGCPNIIALPSGVRFPNTREAARRWGDRAGAL